MRELARELKLAPSTISKYLDLYEKEGVLSKKKQYNLLLFKANSSSELFRLRKRHFLLEQLFSSGLIEFIVFAVQPEAIVLFGSGATGFDDEKSDIDIFIQTFAVFSENITPFEKYFKKKIHISGMSVETLKKNPNLANSIANGVVLYGVFEVI